MHANRASARPAKGNGPRLLLVDDEAQVLRALERALSDDASDILTAQSAEAALEVLAEHPEVQVVVSDFRMPGMDGVEFLGRVKERWPRIQRVMLTGMADRDAIEGAINRSEIFRLISKPWDSAQLATTIRSAYEQFLLVEENERLYAELQLWNASLEEKIAERTRLLAHAKAEWELSFDAIRDPLAIIEKRYEVGRLNRAFALAAHAEVDGIPGKICHQVLFEKDAPCKGCRLADVLTTGEAGQWNTTDQDRQFRVRAFRLPGEDGAEPRAVVTYQDITEEERINRQLFQTEKMAAVGQLAGGVAHEINNPLAAIMAFSQMMKSEPRGDDDLEQLTYIEDSAKRCMRIVESLLHFSRTSSGEEDGPIDLAKMFSEVQILSGPLTKGTSIDVVYVLDEDAPAPIGSRNQLEQVVMNLVTNGIQAIESEGTVRVRAHTGPRGVRLTVEDSGPGIPPEVESRIFEPFFTTKPEGKGTGLGLAISYKIIERMRGELSISRSEEFGGAEFTIDLPAHGGESV